MMPVIAGCHTRSAKVHPTKHGEPDLIVKRLSSDRVLDRSALDWFVMLRGFYFPERDSESSIGDAVLTYGSGYFDIVIKALSPSGFVLNPPRGKNIEDEIENNRQSALGVCMVLREKAKPILPELMSLMKDRHWAQRLFCANAISTIGPKASGAIPMAMVDLTFEDPEVRRQGLTVLGGVGGQSKGAVDTLIRYTESDSDLLMSVAIWELGRVMKSKDSDPELVELARDTIRGLALGHGPTMPYARGVFGWDRNAPREIYYDYE